MKDIILEIPKYILGFVIGIPLLFIIAIIFILPIAYISFKNRNKPYVRTRKPYRQWQYEQLLKYNQL